VPLSAEPEALDARGSMVLLATLSGRFFFNFASIEDSRSGNGGISSRIVAYKTHRQSVHLFESVRHYPASTSTKLNFSVYKHR